MKVVIQRVESASVNVSGRQVGKIDLGYLVLAGFEKGDGKKDVEKCATKLVNLRIMGDKKDKMNLNLRDVGGSVLMISQFTLIGNTTKGSRPSFMNSLAPTEAQSLYNYLIKLIKDAGIRVAHGVFGAKMTINAQLDGPVTIIL